MSNLKNINLDVANFAMKCVKDAIECDKIDCNKYKTLVKKMPTLIQKNGFINTLAFVLSKCNIKGPKKDNDIIKKQFNNKILEDIIKWTEKNSKTTNLIKFKEKKIDTSEKENNQYSTDNIVKYLEEVSKLKPLDYRLITKEMMNLFSWTKRFSDGMIEDKTENEGE